MSNPIYRWIHEGQPLATQGLPDSLLDQVKRDPRAHPTARMDATFELDRRRPPIRERAAGGGVRYWRP